MMTPLQRETPALPGLFAGFASLLRRDLQLAWLRRGQAVNPLIFFAMVTALVPLAVGPESALLARLAPGMVWIMALLGALLAADALFHEDFADGALEHLVLSPQPLWLLVLAKVIAHWLVIGLPITLLAPLLGLMLALPEAGFMPLLVGLALGTLVFSLLGAVGGALTVALGGRSVLMSLLVLPLYVPVLIFGTTSVTQSLAGVDSGAPLALLGAVAALALAVGPFAAAAALRVGIDG